MIRLRLRILIVCGAAILSACGGTSATIPAPPTATTAAPSDTPAPAATVAAPTEAPTPQVTPAAASATAAPAATATSGTAATTASRDPRGTPPRGWKTYPGTARIPFAVYYPPDWTVDESEVATKGQVKFFSPTRNPYLLIHVGTEKTTTSIDTLRDAQAKALAQSCVRSGVELTQQGTVSGVVFNELVMSCDLADQGQLSVFLLGAGLNHGYPWDITAYSPRKDFNHNTCACPAGNVEAFFDPMLNSANIYSDPVG